MPPSSAPDDDLRAIIAYLRSIGTAGAGERSAGNAINGERIFSANCSRCHRVNGRGGRLGPDLSQIGNQPRQALTRSIRDASASFTIGYEPVTLATRDGQQIRGARKSEDPFSIQIMDTRERLQGYLKTDLRDVTHDTKSLMPDYGPDRVSDQDLTDLLGFLATLRASTP
jgi:putative heme-binding domain-containing protein